MKLENLLVVMIPHKGYTITVKVELRDDGLYNVNYMVDGPNYHKENNSVNLVPEGYDEDEVWDVLFSIQWATAEVAAMDEGSINITSLFTLN